MWERVTHVVANLQHVKGGLKSLRKSLNSAPQSLEIGIKEILWIQSGFKKINPCDRTLINNEVPVLKWEDIWDVEISCLQIWESWWCRVKEQVFKIQWILVTEH